MTVHENASLSGKRISEDPCDLEPLQKVGQVESQKTNPQRSLLSPVLLKRIDLLNLILPATREMKGRCHHFLDVHAAVVLS